MGRDELTALLAETASRHHVCALVGASGGGKSSLLRAGLVPRLRHPQGDAVRPAPAAVRVLTPGHTPRHTLNVWSRLPVLERPGCWSTSSRNCLPSVPTAWNEPSSWSDCWARVTTTADCA
ncbi:hypothetical protein [Streptomyces sp. 2224.1]|uniref:nSTAND1 domain-containing NTPase n=1 Tax=Streptomyces sp. 2224.1 TaxID=1881020 RepID=UPI003526997D